MDQQVLNKANELTNQKDQVINFKRLLEEVVERNELGLNEGEIHEVNSLISILNGKIISIDSEFNNL